MMRLRASTLPPARIPCLLSCDADRFWSWTVEKKKRPTSYTKKSLYKNVILIIIETLFDSFDVVQLSEVRFRRYVAACLWTREAMEFPEELTNPDIIGALVQVGLHPDYLLAEGCLKEP